MWSHIVILSFSLLITYVSVVSLMCELNTFVSSADRQKFMIVDVL